PPILYSVPLSCDAAHRDLHSFPTRRSSDLELEEGFGIDATDIYGLSEVMGPGVALECVETKDGLTVWEDHFYPEIVHPETLEPLDRKSTRLNSSHVSISYAVFCLKKKNSTH